MRRLVTFPSRSACRFVTAVTLFATVFGGAFSGRVAAQGPRFLAKEDIILLGLGLTVQPAKQTVPKNIATIVSTFLQSPNQVGNLPPFAPDAEVHATLNGPAFSSPQELVTKPNSPLNIPPLPVAGTYTVESIRLVSGGQVLLYGSPEAVEIDVIDKLLVTQVTARALTADEIRAAGIVFDKSSFQAYNFTAAFAVSDGPQIQIDFPVVLPTLKSPQDLSVSTVDLTTITPPALKSLSTIVPDTLKIQTQIPNLSVTGFSLQITDVASQDFFVPPIAGVIVIPGDIAFLNQFFNITLMVGNAAPTGSGLVVSNLTAAISLPAGPSGVVGADDAPLRMATTANGPSPGTQPVAQPGPDGKLGTADDITTLAPGETGQSQFLVEGRREGTFTITMDLEGTLNGLPVGPVPISGRAAGAVVVRNPKFTLTFTHPDVVNAGEPYTLDVTVTNTSDSPANFVSIDLNAQNISGATLAGPSSQSFDTIAPSDSQTGHFDLVSNLTGNVTAATLDSDSNIAGHFQLKTAVGELGVPLSPDELILPQQANSLPQSLRDAALGLLARAWAVAVAPPAAVPSNLQRFSKQVVLDHAVDVAEAGFRYSLGEALPDSASQLLFDFMGSAYPRLNERVTTPDNLPFAQQDYQGFDLLRRLSVRGDVFGNAVGSLIADALARAGAAPFHLALAEKLAYRPPHISVLVTDASGQASPVNLVVLDSSGNQVGGGAAQKITKGIPYSDYMNINNAGGAITAQFAFIAVPQPGQFTVQLQRLASAPANEPYTVSVVFPGSDGLLHHAAFSSLGPNDIPTLSQPSTDPYQLTFQILSGGATITGNPVTATLATVPDPPPTVLGAVQMANADTVGCPAGVQYQAGRIVAVLFSKEVTPASVQDQAKPSDITNFLPEASRAVGVALQPGRRIVFIALRDPLGPFINRSMTVQNVQDRIGQSIGSQTMPMQATVTDPGGVVSGQLLKADGTPVAFGDVRMFYEFRCDGGLITIGISEKTADAQGHYSWDYVVEGPSDVKIVADTNDTQDQRVIRFVIQRDGQRLNADIVFLGRGSYKGRTLDQDGITPLVGSSIRVTSLTDQSQYGATSDANGQFEIDGIPVGNILIEAVNPARPAQIFLSDNITFAGATITRDLVLLDLTTTNTGPTTIHVGTLSGHALRSDGITPVVNVPVVAYYETDTQAGVSCPPINGSVPAECAIAVTQTDQNGRFIFSNLTAGAIRVNAVDQTGLAQGDANVLLPLDGSFDFNLFVAGGLGTVKGVVLDHNGNPVTDAQVGGGLSITTVDATGHFTLADVPIGHRDIVATSNALQSRGTSAVDLVTQGEVVNTTIVMDAVGSIAGIVHKFDGTPASSISVYVFQECFDDQGNPSICISGTAVTDQNGAYRVNKLQIGTYGVSAFLRDFSDGNIALAAIRAQGEIARTDITFRGGGGIVTGTVLSSNGVTPLKGKVGISGDQVVIAGNRVGVKFEHVENFQIVDSDFTTGVYTLNKVWVGPFTLRAAGQFSPDPVTFAGTMPTAGATVTQNLQLQPTSQVTGTLLQPDGVTPVAKGVSVKYHSNGYLVFCAEDEFFISTCNTIPQGIQEEFAVTDAQGRFAFPIVNAGPFTLTATDPSTGKLGQVIGNVRAGDTADVTMQLMGLAAIQVNVFNFDGSKPIPNAKVDIQELGYPKRSVTGVAATGSITFAGGDALDQGQFTVMATDLGSGFAGRGSGTITTDGQTVVVNINIANATGTVAGTVFQSDGLTAAPNASVVLSNTIGPLAFAVSGSDGTYNVGLIPLGAFSIDAFDSANAGHGHSTGSVDFNAEVVPANITLDPLGVVEGTVIDSDTLVPLAGWEVVLHQTSVSGLVLPDRRTETGVDGGFSFPGASVGSFSLVAQSRTTTGTGTATGQLARGGQAITIQVPVKIVKLVTGSVKGTVFNPNGTPAGSAEVQVCPAGQACQTTTGASDGTFAFSNIPLGRFTATAQAQVTSNISVGITAGSIFFDGDTANVTITLVGLSTVKGTVVHFDGSPATNVTVQLTGQPGSGCQGPCSQGTDVNGQFSFPFVPARTFTVSAADVITGLKGSVGDTLNPGDTKNVRIVLQPSGSVRGVVFFSDGTPAPGISVQLALAAGGFLFAQSAPDGSFVFDTVAVGVVTLTLQDPIGIGIAKRTDQVTTGTLDFGDILLDDTFPAVGQSTPPANALSVPLNQIIQIKFTKPVDLSTVNANTITVTGPQGVVSTVLTVGSGDSSVSVQPLSPLGDNTQYVLRVSGVQDRVGRVMKADYVAPFSTLDKTPPSFQQVSPTAGSTGAPTVTTIRVQYSESIDPTTFQGAPITLTGPAGPVAGTTSYSFANTVVIFTPTFPLANGTQYAAQVQPAQDLSHNVQPQGLNFQFVTASLTPPQITALTPSNGGKVIENTTAQVVATLAPGDIAFVDFFINGTLAFTSRTAPFAILFKAIPAYGTPGNQIKVSAAATDTSGNRSGLTDAFLTVIADQPPAVTIVAPISGSSAGNGQIVTVQVHATDDVGVVQAGFKAGDGNPRDAATHTLNPASLDDTESFAFTVPNTIGPGTITIQATARDTKGQTTQSTPVTIKVLDTVPPGVSIAGVLATQRVKPGQQLSVVVSANDLGGVASIGLNISGAATFSNSVSVSPAQNSAATTFSFGVSPTAGSNDTVIIDAFALDQAGNRGASRLILAVGDLTPPTVQLVSASGRLEMVAGRSVSVIANASDDLAVQNVAISGSGAFSMADAKPVSPPAASASVTFTINVPSTVPVGGVLNLVALAMDTSGNVSAPATLSLTAAGLSDITLPPSLLFNAGDTVNMTVQLPAPAPAGGVTVTFTSANSAVVAAPIPLTFAPGDTSKSVALTGISGGTSAISALIDGFERATTTATVVGGVVRGVVMNTQLQAVAGAQVTVFHSGAPLTAVTDAGGNYLVTGVASSSFSVRAQQVQPPLFGQASGNLNVAGGSATVNVVLLSAGELQGTVLQTDGTTPAGVGVRVDLFEKNAPTTIIATTFTDATSSWQFSLLAPGAYNVQASDVSGNIGGATATIAGGDVVSAPIAFLGRGSVTGGVFDGLGNPVPNAVLQFQATSIFGNAPVISGNAGDDGHFRFDHVLAGTFIVTAHDPVSNLGGSSSGTLSTNGQVVNADIKLAPFANLRGTIFESDGTTTAGPAVNVTVNVCGGGTGTNCVFTTQTDTAGGYHFDFVPFAPFTLRVSDPSNRGIAVANGVFGTIGETRTLNVNLAGQGTLLVTVTDTNGVGLAGAAVQASAANGPLTDQLSGATDSTGKVALQNLLAGSFTVTATSSGSQAQATGTLSTGTVLPVTLVIGLKHLVSISASPSTITLTAIGQQQPITVTGVFSDNTTATITSNLTFQSSNSGFASVSASGVVTAVAAGSTTVTVSAPGVSPSQVLVVVRSLTSIALQPSALSLVKGQTRTLAVIGTFSDSSTGPITSGVTFQTSDNTIVTVAADGTVTAVAPGSATITGTFGALTPAQATVTVQPRQMTGLTITPSSISLTGVGQTTQPLAVSATFNDGSTGTPTSPISFSSRNIVVATVDANGVVTAVATGSTFIDVTSGTLAANVPVTVNIPVTGQAPVINSLGRPIAGEGDTVVILGQNFAALPANNEVFIGGLPMSVTSASAERLVAIVPSGATSGPLQVIVGGQSSNQVSFNIYARVAQSTLVTGPLAPSPVTQGQVVDLGTSTVHVETGDQVLLSGFADTIVGPTFNGLPGVDFTGALFVTINGADTQLTPSSAPTDLTQRLVVGNNTVRVRLEERGGQLSTKGLSLVVGPPNTGAFAGRRYLTADTIDRQMTVRFRLGLPDGTNVAATTVNSPNLDGGCCSNSAGGAIVNGTPTPNDGNFRTFTVANGEIAVTYSSVGVLAGLGQSVQAVISVVTADSSGNRTGSTTPIAIAQIQLGGLDSVTIVPAQLGSLADGLDRPMSVVLNSFRDANGRQVPDGAVVGLTAVNWYNRDGGCCDNSVGGAVESGAASPNNGNFRTFTVTGGAVQAIYSPIGVNLTVGDVRTAVLAVVTAGATNSVLLNPPFGTAGITLSSVTTANIVMSALPASLAATTMDNRAVVTVSGFTDAVGNPIPDGTKLGLTAVSWYNLDGGCCNSSAGGAIIGGTTSPNNGNFQVFPITNGQIVATYSDAGLVLGVGQTTNAVVSVMPADASNSITGSKPFANLKIALGGVSSATITPAQSSTVADGVNRPITVTVTNLRDAFGNQVPDGTKIALTAVSWYNRDGGCCNSSVGGGFIDGTTSPNEGHHQVYTVVNGQVTATYSAAGVTLNVGDVRSSVISAVVADAANSIKESAPFATATITLSSASGGQLVASPTSLLADYGSHLSAITVTNLTDSQGLPVPDGTNIGVTAVSWYNLDGGCCNGSAGGGFVGGTAAPNDSNFKVFTVKNGQLTFTYSDQGVFVGTGATATAVIALLPADVNFNRIGSRPLARVAVTLTGMAAATFNAPATVPPSGTATVTFSHIVDALGVPVPDGTKVALTGVNWYNRDGGCCNNSAGGSFSDGTPAVNDANFKIYTVTNGQITATFQAPGADGVTSVISAVPADGSNNRDGTPPFAFGTIRVTSTP